MKNTEDIGVPVPVLSREDNEGLLAAIVDSSDDAIISILLDGTITSWNAAAERVFGFSAPEATGRLIDLIVPESRRTEQQQILEQVQSGLRVEHFETTRCHKDGSEVLVSLTISPIRDGLGHIIGASKIVRDISQLKTGKEKQALLASIVDSSEDVIVSKTLDGIITSWNSAAERTFGYTASEAVGKHITLIIPKERHDEETMILSKIRAGEKVENFETIRQRKDGTRVHISLTVSPVRDTDGKIIGASKIARNIDLRLQQEKKEALLAAIVDSSEDAIVSKTLEGVITSWNSGAERIFGYSAEEAVNRHISLIIPDDRLHEETMILSRVRAGLKVEHFETMRRRKDGRLVNISVTVSPVLDTKGRIIGASKIARSIDEKRFFEEKQALLASIVDSSDDAIVSKTLDGIITSWNAGAERIFGYSAHEAVGRHISLIIPRERLDEETLIISKVRTGDRVEHFETVRRRKDGTPIHISLTVSPVRDPRGKIIGASKIARDISDRKKSEENQAILAAIVSTSDDAIISKTLDGIITSWNASAERIFGFTAREAINRHISIIIPPDRMNEEALIISKVKKGERVEHYETQRLTKSGELINISLTISPIKNAKGEIVGASKIARDITDKTNILRKLEQYTEELQKLNRHKDEFIGVASHELKTPLTSIMAYLQLLQRNPDDPSKIKFIDKALQHVNKLSNLVNDLLDVSKIEAGKLQMNFSEWDLNAIVKETCESFQDITNSHRLHIALADEPLLINGDRVRIEQVLTNLLTNAVKYSPDGKEIRVSVNRLGRYGEVSVQDFGMGIPPDQQQKIFTRFYRAEKTPHFISGLGIGLFISAEIIKRHQGSIWVESINEQGSTFRFNLPLAVRF